MQKKEKEINKKVRTKIKLKKASLPKWLSKRTDRVLEHASLRRYARFFFAQAKNPG